MSNADAEYPNLSPQSTVVALLHDFGRRLAQENDSADEKLQDQLARIDDYALNIAAAAEPPLTVWAANAKVRRSKVCPWWTVRDGVIVVCGHLSCPDRENHRRNKKLWSAAGFGLEDRHEMGHRFPRPCDGWVRRNVTSVCGRACRTDVLTECGRLSCPDRDLHAKAKKLWNSHGLALGAHHEKKHELPKPSPLVLFCEEWVIRDGKIAECGKPFTPKKRPCASVAITDAKYGPCHPKGRKQELWRKHGHYLGESIRRTCDYRDCRRGENGGKKIFDKVKRSPTGLYFCCEYHSHQEMLARKIDRAIAKFKQGGASKKDAAHTRRAEIGLKVETEMPLFARLFEIKAKKPAQLRDKLIKAGASRLHCEAVSLSRNAQSAARWYVANSCYPPLGVESVGVYHRRYLAERQPALFPSSLTS